MQDCRKMRSEIRDQRSEIRGNYCLLFNIKNEHLLKELGLLAWGMHKYLGYNSCIATYQNGEYPSMKFLPGLELKFIPKITGKFRRDSYMWLLKNSRKIDVLHLFHFGGGSFRQALVYKIFNPKGKVYLKFDGGPKSAKFREKLALKLLIDFCSVEFSERVEHFQKMLNHKIGFVPNPIHPDEIQEFKNFTERENIIFTSGRLGTHQKATEILLNAFTKICDKIPNWKLKLAGKFRENINIADEFFKAHPELKDRVIFAGMINDREQLINMYRESKIFAFPSRFEGCSIALAEAFSQGNFVIASDIPPNRLMAQNFKFAYYHEVDDVNTLAEKLFYACTHENEIENLAREGQKAIIKRCNLEKCCKTIQKGLNLNS